MAFHSAYFEMAISKARAAQTTVQPIQLDFKTYPEETMKVPTVLLFDFRDSYFLALLGHDVSSHLRRVWNKYNNPNI